MACALLCLCFCSCSLNERNGYGQQIDIDLDKEVIDSIPLSQLIDSITYSTLNLGDSLVIGRISDMSITDSMIIILDEQTKSVLKFANNGRFLYPIGSNGQGPGEYIAPEAIDTDDENIYVYDYMQLSVLKYKHDGEFVGRDSVGYADDFVKIDMDGSSCYLLASYNSRAEFRGIYFSDGKQFKKLFNFRDDFPRNHPWEFFKADDDVFIMTKDYENVVLKWNGDSIETVLDLNVTPRPTDSELSKWDSDGIDMIKHFNRTKYYASPRWCIINYWRGGEPRIVIYDNTDNSIVVTRHIYNDMDTVPLYQGLPNSVDNSLIYVPMSENTDDKIISLQYLHLK